MGKQGIKLTKWVSLQFVILLSVNYSEALTEEDLIVEVGDLGNITGTGGVTSGDSIEYIRFAGIPYANHERFLPSTLKEGPLVADGGNFSANGFTRNCYQPNGLPAMQTEDCLSINVWTRKVNREEEPTPGVLRPVIVFVHGGGFIIGNGGFFPGSVFLKRDVVFVNFNYRLGVLGFFCMGSDNAPGNAGMYDVVTALQWVQKYIKYFGGDPNKVTLAGQSAGAVAVTLMMVSPMGEGLFHRAIAASGSVLNAWGAGSLVEAKASSMMIAKGCGCFDSNGVNMTDVEIVNCMKNANATCLVQELVRYQRAERLEGRLGFGPASPVIQNFELQSTSKLLEDNPTKLFNDGKQANLPLIMGTTRHDGSYVMGENLQSFLIPNNLTDNKHFMTNDLVPWILQALGIVDNSYGIYDTIAKTYLGESRLTGDLQLMLPGLIDLHNVFFFKAAAYRTAILHSKLNNNTYWYSFDYKGRTSFWDFLFAGNPPNFPGGVAHTDDMLYLFPFLDMPNPEETKVINAMLDYWTHFAENGNPTPFEGNLTVWPILNEDDKKFLSINADSHVMDNFPDEWVDASLELFPELITTTTEETSESTATEEPVSTTTEEPVSTTTEEPISTTTEEPVSTTTEEPISSTTEEAPPSTTAGVGGVTLLSIINLIAFSLVTHFL